MGVSEWLRLTAFFRQWIADSEVHVSLEKIREILVKGTHCEPLQGKSRVIVSEVQGVFTETLLSKMFDV